MAQKNKKINVKERFTDGQIDLSMSDLDEVPVKEIALLKKATFLDISNNRLVTLPPTFTSLIHITKLDLSKNELKELPEDFGNLYKLKYLDLYQNQLQHLPLSFCKLKDLRFLDLKDNQLVPTVAKVAGPCLDTKQCQNCARDVVSFFTKLQEQVQNEVEIRNKHRQKQLEMNQQKKQEEKKLKKKEKQKQKQVISYEPVFKPKMNSNGHKTYKKVLKKEKSRNFPWFKSFLTLFLSFSIALFVSTSINYKHTRHISKIVSETFSRCILKLPSNLQEYGVKTGEFFSDFHQKTGNFTMELGTKLNFEENFKTAKDLFFVVYNIVATKCLQLYEHFTKNNVQ